MKDESMNKINFVIKWNRRGRAITWSGTPYGIYNALERRGVVINDVSLGEGLLSRIKYGIYRMYQRMTGKNDLMLFSIKQCEKELRKDKRLERGVPSLYFFQYWNDDMENSYVYQDFSVAYLDRLRVKAPEEAKLTPLEGKISERTIKVRRQNADRWAKACRGIFTMSEYLAKDYVENDGIAENNVHCVGGGCNMDVTKIDTSKKNGYRFIFIGIDWIRKNGPLVVEGFREYYKMNPKAELYIIGPSTEPTEIVGVSGIKYIGRINYDETREYLNLCDYFVLPSRCEAYGIVFGEALVFGLPCIARDAYAMPDFIEDGKNGYLLKHETITEMRDKFKEMFDNREQLTSYVEARREEYIKRFSWDTVADRIIDVMKQDGYFTK